MAASILVATDLDALASLRLGLDAAALAVIYGGGFKAGDVGPVLRQFGTRLSPLLLLVPFDASRKEPTKSTSRNYGTLLSLFGRFGYAPADRVKLHSVRERICGN